MDHVHIQGPAQKTQGIISKNENNTDFFGNKKKNLMYSENVPENEKKYKVGDFFPDS